jgi:hypothetical protein
MLPIEFSTPRLDEHGRRYVVHSVTGTRYYVREQNERGGHVVTYARNPDAKPQQRPPRRQRSAPTHQECPLVQRRIACNACGYPASESRYASVEEFQKRTGQAAPKSIHRSREAEFARATFIEGSAP